MISEKISDNDMIEVKRIVKSLPLERKLEILTILEEELFAGRFKALLKEFRESSRKYPLTLEEITREVELVRQKRYESGN